MDKLNSKIGAPHKAAFLGTILIGLLIHLPVMLSDVPNHDGLSSMYFDQNMITSGRWFLTVACGFSSYFTVPWIIGILGLGFLGMTAMALTELLEIRQPSVAVLCGGLLVAFPALASTFAYVFTLDGYMLAMLLSVLAVLVTKKYRRGFWAGALCLAFSMGIYQAYLPFAILLCIYQVSLLLAEGGWSKDRKGTLQKTGSYLGMGVLGFAAYYAILRILLMIQGKELASYQGIGTAGALPKEGMLVTLRQIYVDFVTFTLGGHILFQNLYSAAAVILLTLLTLFVLAKRLLARKWWKKLGFYGTLVILALAVPICTSCIRLVSSELNYHLLMRYQWVLFLIGMLAFCARRLGTEELRLGRAGAPAWWILLVSTVILIFCYGLADNVAYVNLAKKYERTYAYCIRLLDRIEQTEGYYQGIPVALTGVVGEDAFPAVDLTGEVTGNMIGLSGDYLLYTGANYEAFIKHYLGATLNIVDVEVMGEIYYKDEYVAMDGFPGPNSTKVVDGILYVKTENSRRD